MPTPNDEESEEDFVSRCIPIVLKEGTAEDNKQAAAICHSMFTKKNNSNMQLLTNHLKLVINKEKRYEKDNYVGYPLTIITKQGVMNEGFKPAVEVKKFANLFQEYGLVLPVTVNHPDNQYFVIVSENDMVGTFGHNTEYNEETTQVSTEMRILKKHTEVIEKIDNEEYPDDSIGYFALTEKLEDSEIFVDEGFSGDEKEYRFIERNLFPNHLAILGANEGACSRKDGCGIFANAKFKPPESGDLPEGGKKILASTYNSCRQTWVDAHPDDTENADNKTRCSKIAWSAVRKAGYEKGEDGNWKKNELITNDMVADLKTMKKEFETNILDLVKEFEMNTGLSVSYISLDRGDWKDNESWVEHMERPIKEVNAEVYLNKDKVNNIINSRGGINMVKPKKNYKECQKCGSVFRDGLPACPVCGNKDFIDAGTEGPLDLEGDAYEMTWVKPTTIPRPDIPAEGVIGNMTEEKKVNELTEDDLKENPHVQELNKKLEDIQKVNAELLEFKEKIEAAELNSLREQAKSIIPEDQWEKFGLDKDDISIERLNTIIEMQTNGLVPKKEENIDHLRTGGDNSQDKDKETAGSRIRRKQFANATWQEIPPKKEED